jgi:hypothetical protein
VFKWVSLAFDVAKFVFRLTTREPEPARPLPLRDVQHIQRQIEAGVAASRAAAKAKKDAK